MPTQGWIKWSVLLIFCFFVSPAGAETLPSHFDPYEFTTLRGSVDFEYEKYTETGHGRDREYDRFGQLYSLSFRSNIWDPRFLIYDMFVLYFDDNREGDQPRDRNELHYGFESTLLPKSLLPVSFFADRQVIETTTTGPTDRAVINTYGYSFDWLLRFRRLPYVGLHLKQTWSTGTNVDREQLDYGANLSKRLRLGRTKNLLSYSYNKHEIQDNFHDRVTGDDANVFTLSSIATFSSDTKLRTGATRFITNDWDEGRSEKNDGVGVNFEVDSGISNVFEQHHHYIFTDTDRDLERNGRTTQDSTMLHNYTGNFTFTPSYDFKATGHAFMSDTSTESNSNVNENQRYELVGNVNYEASERLHLEGFASVGGQKTEYATLLRERSNAEGYFRSEYRMTNHLSSTGSVRYQMVEQPPGFTGDDITERTSRERLDAQAGLIYRRKFFRRLDITLSYSGGYFVEYRDPEEDGEGWVQTVSGSLRSPLDLRYVVLSANYSASDYMSHHGETDSTSKVLSVSATSKNIRYIHLSNHYVKKELDSFNNLDEEQSEKNTTVVQTTFMKNTRAKAERIYYDVTRPLSGEYSAVTTRANVRHQKYVWDGNLALSFDYYAVDSDQLSPQTTLSGTDFVAATRDFSRKTYLGSYGKRLSRFLSAEAEFRREEEKLDDELRKRDIFEGILSYRLRSWFIDMKFTREAEYFSYFDDTVIEKRLLVRIHRSFIRTF